jgi:hypothetical protein
MICAALAVRLAPEEPSPIATSLSLPHPTLSIAHTTQHRRQQLHIMTKRAHDSAFASGGMLVTACNGFDDPQPQVCSAAAHAPRTLTDATKGAGARNSKRP